jgi:hypothetical protein
MACCPKRYPFLIRFYRHPFAYSPKWELDMWAEPRDINLQHYQVGDIDRRSLLPLLGAGAAFLMLAGKAQAQ